MKFEKGWAFPDVDEFMVSELKSDGTYQSGNLHAALPFVTDHALAIDGGAHVGTWSRLMSGLFDQVIACEPCADTFEALLTNLAAFKCDNVDARHVALGAKTREVRMVLDGRGAQMRNTGARHVSTCKTPDGELSACHAIDQWRLPSLGLLKLDIEGSEVDALHGAAGTIRRCTPVILFENKGLWQQFGHRREAPQDFLKGLGYRLLATASCDAIWGPA